MNSSRPIGRRTADLGRRSVGTDRDRGCNRRGKRDEISGQCYRQEDQWQDYDRCQSYFRQTRRSGRNRYSRKCWRSDCLVLQMGPNQPDALMARSSGLGLTARARGNRLAERGADRDRATMFITRRRYLLGSRTCDRSAFTAWSLPLIAHPS